MNATATRQRQTKYCEAIESALSRLGHATNLQLLQSLRSIYPDVSATTVHRASTRLATRGRIGVAPTARDGSMRYDSTVLPHDHFVCSSCSLLRDADIVDRVKPILEQAIDGCAIDGRLTISGLCKQCKGNQS